jgi:hypothetical protein
MPTAAVSQHRRPPMSYLFKQTLNLEVRWKDFTFLWQRVCAQLSNLVELQFAVQTWYY